MSFEYTMKQRFLAVSLQLDLVIETLAREGLNALGLQANYDKVLSARNQMLEKSPLYVKQINIHGSLCQNMYDNHIGYAYFYTDCFKDVKVPPFCRLSDAIHISYQEFIKIRDENCCVEKDYDGLFIPREIIILDQFDNKIYRYTEDSDWEIDENLEEAHSRLII